MYIQPSQYSHVHRGRCLPNCLSRNGRSCNKRLQPKQNPTNSFCASLYILYMSCDLQIMANLQKKYRTRVFISRKLTHMLLCVLIFTCGLMSIIYSMVVQATVTFAVFILSAPISCLCPPAVVHIARHFSAPICREYFLFSHYQLSLITPCLFAPPQKKIPKKHLCQREKSVGETENPLPHNRKSALP